MKFQSDVTGYITGIRFYKGTGNTGTHVGHLWTSTGTLLASATFSGETATGWQQVTFATPVAITANTVYVASYYAPVGRYAYNEPFFATKGVDNAPLHALANSVAAGNGVYAYGNLGLFPNSTYNSTNYWVDVVMTAKAPVVIPTVTAQTPALNATSVVISAAPTVTFNEAVTSSTIGFTLKNAAGTAVTATLA